MQSRFRMIGDLGCRFHGGSTVAAKNEGSDLAPALDELRSNGVLEVEGDRAVESATLAELRRPNTDAASVAQLVNFIQ